MKSAREAILNAAIRLFAQKGYAASTIREICKNAGITKPVLYYHFHNKEHLYQELMIDILSLSRKSLLSASNIRGSLRERLVQYVLSDFRNCREDPIRVRFIFRMMFSPEDEHPYFNYIEEFKRQRQVIISFFKEGIEAGVVCGDPQVLARALSGMQLDAILDYILTGRQTLTRRNAEKFVDVLLRSAAGKN